MTKNVIEDLADNESLMEKLRSPCPPTLNEDSCQTRRSNGKAVLSIFIDGMKKENVKKVFKAARLLNEAGVKFNTGMGFGDIDWIFDKSLEGAYVKVSKGYLWYGNCTCPWDGERCSCGAIERCEKKRKKA